MADSQHNSQHPSASDQSARKSHSFISVSIDDATDDANGMPEHWKPPTHPVFKLFFHLLCLVSVSRPSLEYHREAGEDQESWEKQRIAVCSRLHNTNILGGLVLAASAVFLSTPPPLPSLLPYTGRISYILTLASFAHALGGALTGGVVIFVYETCDRLWARNILTSTRFRLYATLIFLAWPGLSLAMSLLCLMFALVLAAFMSGIGWLQALAVLELLAWAWLPPTFIWCAVPESSWDDLARKARRWLWR
ncbi:hypothetical protein F5I97DRAFT_1924625 [Phlebopus sp. FC_14]|nr:hypothetical protein F5I97DRAFT_1924625 [Phlebopus sp. FC_14]